MAKEWNFSIKNSCKNSDVKTCTTTCPASLYPQILHALAWDGLCHNRPAINHISYSMAELETGQINVGATDRLHCDCDDPGTSVTGIPFMSWTSHAWGAQCRICMLSLISKKNRVHLKYRAITALSPNYSYYIQTHSKMKDNHWGDNISLFSTANKEF